MKHTFFVTTAAAALLASTGLASAQATIERAPAASEQKAAPEVKSDTKIQAKDQKATTGAQIKAEEKPKMDAQAPAARAKSETSGQAAPAAKSDTKASDTKAQGMQKQDSAAPAAKSGADTKSSTTVQSDTKSGTAASGSTSASVSLNTEQKTKIRETVIKSSNAPRVANVNFSLSIGTAVPKTVRFAPLPPLLVEINPSWRGYEYFLVGDQIVVVNPRTLQIVAILDV
jgi:hypothetical protein